MKSTSTHIAASAQMLPIEEIANYPLPGMAVPGSLTFSPDHSLITFLQSPDGSLNNALYRFDPQTGNSALITRAPGEGVQEDGISLDEALRRERQRQRNLGITHYYWIDNQTILLPIQGEIYIYAPTKNTLTLLQDNHAGPCLDPQSAPDGKNIAYAQNGELFVVSVESGIARQLTFSARAAGITNGIAEFIAQEEMGRSQGYWWSPDSQYIAFEEVDENHIPVYRITHQGKDATGEYFQEDHRYPFPGQANAYVRLGVVCLADGKIQWMDLGDDKDIYLARVGWLADGTLVAQVENRMQSELRLLQFDLATGQSKELLRETSHIWVNLHDLFYPLGCCSVLPDGGFIWASERSGFRHLYLYNRQGQLLHALTEGNWMVDAIAGVDIHNETVYFTATRSSPLETHLFSVPLAGGEVKQITQEPGTHAITLDIAGNRFIDTHSSIHQPPQISLRDLSTDALIQTIFHSSDPRIAALHLQPPELVNIRNRDGIDLFGAIYRPPAAFGAQPHPTIIQVYGGPHAQSVTNSWNLTVNMRAQFLRSLGYLVFILDNRGSARRGLEFEGAIRHRMGVVEVDDQVDGVHWLVSQGLSDPNRVGIYGWSYGGYMAAMCLAKAPETFQVAVAGAPVTQWDGYDTHYTERYMGLPQQNPSGYAETSVMAHVNNMQGKLMLVHGLIDENVHFRHTARLINALIKARKRYELLLFPDERHMPRGIADRVYMEERIRDFFAENL